MSSFITFLFIYLFLTVLVLAAVCGLSLVVEVRGYSLARVCRFRIVAASFVAEHKL